MAKKNYVIDTSVFLSDADALFSFDINDIFIPLKVLEEIDKHKKRQDSVGFNARKIIKHLDALRAKGSLSKGIRPKQGKGIIMKRPQVTSRNCLFKTVIFVCFSCRERAKQSVLFDMPLYTSIPVGVYARVHSYR